MVWKVSCNMPPYVTMQRNLAHATVFGIPLYKVHSAYLLLGGLQRGGKFGAMTFGSITPDGKVSWPSSPTWMTYAGDNLKCMDDVPVLIRPELFCQAFLAEARVFR